jgi:hypothetical protein
MQIDCQLDEIKEVYLAQLKERLMQTTNKPLDNIDIQPCAVEYDSPGESSEFEDLEYEDSD